MKIQSLAKKLNVAQKALAAALALAFLFSLTVYFFKTPRIRHVFRFQSVDTGRNNVEWRLLPVKKGQDKISLYVQELLLGPKNERSRPLFSPGTKANFCFERGKSLYVDFSPEILEMSGNASQIMEGLELFKMNVKRAFPHLKNVEAYIDGKPLVEEF